MGVGDYREDTFTDEEKAALGEADPAPAADVKAEPEAKEGPEPEAKPEGEVTPEGEKPEAEQKPEPTTEEKAAAEEQGFRIETDDKGHSYIVDDDGTRIPPKRFREVYREAKEGERAKEKLDLLKRLGTDAYYQAFPDEKPADYKAPASEPVKQAPEDIGSLTVSQPGGPYDGKTLRELYDMGGEAAVLATQLHTNYLFEHRKAEERKAGELERVKAEALKEIESFAGELAKEAFGKDAPALSKDEEAEVEKTIGAVLDWMNKTHRGGGIIADAYFLMNKEGLLKKISESAAARALKSITDRKGPASIDTKAGGDVKPTGFESYERMTEDQMLKAIDAMPEREFKKLLTDAPASLRRKFPGIF